MKYIKILTLFILFDGYAQDFGANEIKFDALNLVAQSHIQLTFERHLNEHYSLGLSYKHHNNKNDKNDFDNGFLSFITDNQIIPHVRYNFDSSKARYYFIEAFASYNIGQNRTMQRFVENNVGYYKAVANDYQDLALGLAVGYKFYIKKIVVVDAFAGLGKNILSNDESPSTLTRFGLNIGYRF